MPTAEVLRIRQLGWPELRALWAEIVGGTATGWDAGRALEHLVLRSFELDGADVTWPYRVLLNDEEVEQIDGAVFSAGLSCLVECKDTMSPVNIEPLAKLRNQLLRRPAGVIGLAFSRNGFTEPAQTLAQYLAPQTVLLYSGEEIGYLLGKEQMVRPLLRKYRYCVEYGLPTYDNRVEDVP